MDVGSLSITRLVIAGDSRAPFPVVGRGAAGIDSWYLWTAGELKLSRDSTVVIELDPGSGRGGRYRVSPARDAHHVDAACSAFRDRTGSAVESEIQTGLDPAVHE